MKHFPKLLCLAVCLCAPFVLAQEKGTETAPEKMPAAPATQPDKPGDMLPEKPAEPATGPSATKPTFTEPMPLIPDFVPQTDRRSSLSGQKTEAKRARGLVQGTLQERIHYRDVKTRALADGALQQQWDLAQRARTDAGKREGLKRYYTMFFDRLVKLDPALKPKIERRRTLILHSFEQRRIQASELIEDIDGEMPLEAGTQRASDNAD